jgi:hypothetical protein
MICRSQYKCGHLVSTRIFRYSAPMVTPRLDRAARDAPALLGGVHELEFLCIRWS